MAKILPPGSIVDMGLPEESPLEKLNKLFSGVSDVMSGVAAIQQQRTTEHVNAIEMLNNVIDRADDPEDLKNIQNRISSLPYNYHNDAVNIASEALSLKYDQANEDFEYIQGLGDEIANFVTKPLSFTDSKGNNIEKTFSELSVEEMMDYSKSYAGTNELKSGLLGNITENMNKIKQLKDAFGRQFGEKRKNPRFKFKNHLGADVNISEFATISKRYADQMEIFIDAGLGPSDYLNYEEAQLVKNGDVAGYEEKKKQRESEFASYIPRVRREIDSISKMIINLRGLKDDDELSPEFKAGLGNILKLVDAEGNPFAADLALQQEGVQKITDVNNMYEEIVDNFATMSKNGIVDYLGQVMETLKDEEDLNVKAAISWGFGARFGYANVEPDKDALKGLIEESKEIKKEKELNNSLTDEQAIVAVPPVDNQIKQNNILNKKTELKNVKLGKAQLGNKIDFINKKIKEIEQFENNKKINGVPIFELKRDFEKDTEEYLKNKKQLEEYKNSKLSRTTGPWYNKKMSDIGLKMQKLEKKIKKFEKKWESGGITSVDKRTPLFASINFDGLYYKLKLGLSQYSKLNSDLSKLNEEYNSMKKEAAELK
jgi:hypothetical protein